MKNFGCKRLANLRWSRRLFFPLLFGIAVLPNIIISAENGIYTFRGNRLRDSSSTEISNVPRRQNEIAELWRFGPLGGPPKFAGVPWTGQAAVVDWDDKYRKRMPWLESYKKSNGPAAEVIFGSGDGHIYFLDIATGKETRKPFTVSPLPIKGSLSVHPNGLPYLAFGQGLPWVADKSGKKKYFDCGVRLVDLVAMKTVYFINGYAMDPPRGWPAFDGSPLFLPEKDRLLIAGENGIFYRITLNLDEGQTVENIDPHVEILRLSAANVTGSKLGFESSVSYYNGFAYVTSNSGVLYCVDVDAMKVEFKVDLMDDTDATAVISIEDNQPFLYLGNELDWRGAEANCAFFKINGTNGKIVWKHEAPKVKRRISADRLNARSAGFLGTAAFGNGKYSDRLFASITVDTEDLTSKGALFALNKDDGKLLWSYKLAAHTWSSPVFVSQKNADGQEVGTVLIGDYSGTFHAVDAESGQTLWRMKVPGVFHASPIVWHDKILIGTVGGHMFCFGFKR